MKKKMVTQKTAAWTLAAAMTASLFGGQTVMAEEDPFAFGSVSEVTFPLKEKLELDVFVYGTGGGGGFYTTNYVTDHDRPGIYSGYLAGHTLDKI